MDANQAHAVVLMDRLLNIISDEYDDDVPDHILLDHGEHIYRTVIDTVEFIKALGVEPSIEATLLLGRFLRAATKEGWPGTQNGG